MRGAVMHAAGDVRIETVPDPTIEKPTDAVIRVTRACICGSDLWPYKTLKPSDGSRVMGHEAIGVVEETGSDVETVKTGDVVVMPFAFSDGTCVFCEEGLQTACIDGGFFGNAEVPGAQAEAVRVPQADGTLYVLSTEEDDALYAVPHHAVRRPRHRPSRRRCREGRSRSHCRRRRRRSRRSLWRHRGEGTRRGADPDHGTPRRPSRSRARFGATDVVGERGDEAVERIKELTDGYGVDAVLECVGLDQSVETAIEIARPGGAIGRVGVPQHESMPAAGPSFYKNVTIGGGPAPVRAYIDELLPDILDGRIEPGRVFDRTVDLEGVPDGYRAMNDRESIKVLVEP